MIKNGILPEETLKDTYVMPTSMYDGKYTKTTQFMLPAVGINAQHPLIFKFLINAFIGDKEHENDYTRPIFVLMGSANLKDKDWLKVYTTLTSSDNYITEYECGYNEGIYQIMLVFSVPEKFKSDYHAFKTGRYSQFSKEYASKFSRYINEKKKKENVMWQVINKSEELKREIEIEFLMEPGEMDDALEIWDFPRKSREIYRYGEKGLFG